MKVNSILVSLIGANLYLAISPLILTLSAGLLIFLFLNWHPSKFFMGDAGSLFLGAIYFGIILAGGAMGPGGENSRPKKSRTPVKKSNIRNRIEPAERAQRAELVIQVGVNLRSERSS